MSILNQETVGAHIRELRLEHHMSLRTLAARTEFSPSFISQVENGHVSPSINSAQRIAEVLGVTLGEFFSAAAHEQRSSVIRVADRKALASPWPRATFEGLTSRDGKSSLEAVLVELEPGGRSGKHPSARSSGEFAFVLQGAVALTLGPETHLLSEGDAVTILPRELRLWVNDNEKPTRILVLSAPTRGNGSNGGL